MLTRKYSKDWLGSNDRSLIEKVGMTMLEWRKAELLHSERWEDEGGAIIGIKVPLITGRFVRPMPKTTKPPGIPKHWNRKFIIEPIQAETAFGSSKRNAASSK